MKVENAIVDSDSVGDPSRFLSLGDLERRLHELARAPADKGRVSLIIRRGAGGRREILDGSNSRPMPGCRGTLGADARRETRTCRSR